jgi:murein DD-endopeptidase MepM/ murein hydrolase activator NlpD
MLKLRLPEALIVLLLSLLFLPGSLAFAQEAPTLPIYRVDSGDSLWTIAARFGVTVQELSAANNIPATSGLAIGQELVIPGLLGVQGYLFTQAVPFGENLTSLSRKYAIEPGLLAQLNRLVNPNEIYVGANLILLEGLGTSADSGRLTLLPRQSMLELALVHQLNPWSLVFENQIPNALIVMPGEALFTSHLSDTGPGGFPAQVTSLTIKPERYQQGQTVVLKLQLNQPADLSGELAGYKLAFFPEGDTYYALQGIHAMTPPGFYPLQVTGQLENGVQFAFSQWIFVGDAGYPFDPPLTVDPSTIDPAVTNPENEQVAALTAPFTPQRLWQGAFASPVAAIYSDCFPSRFGNRRSYNGSAYDFFHSGLDFCGSVGNDIYAPADGRVVFAGPLTVRGETTIIDHGWGVYTIYMHQSEIHVHTGEMVERGQLIGLVGATGRVTGPHLHWEVWAGGVQADPIYWLQETYP